MAHINVDAAKVAAASQEAIDRGHTSDGTRFDKAASSKVADILLLAKVAVKSGASVAVTDEDMRYIGHCLIDLYAVS